MPTNGAVYIKYKWALTLYQDSHQKKCDLSTTEDQYWLPPNMFLKYIILC